jgi:hypothetical protein
MHKLLISGNYRVVLIELVHRNEGVCGIAKDFGNQNAKEMFKLLSSVSLCFYFKYRLSCYIAIHEHSVKSS